MGHPTRRRTSSRAAFGGMISAAVALPLLAGCVDGATLRTAPTPQRTTPSTAPTVTVTVTVNPPQAPVAVAPSGQPPQPGLAAPQPTPAQAGPLTATRSDPNFSSCKEAVAAGFGPYERGVDQEYGWYPDEDGDGVVCKR